MEEGGVRFFSSLAFFFLFLFLFFAFGRVGCLVCLRFCFFLSFISAFVVVSWSSFWTFLFVVLVVLLFARFFGRRTSLDRKGTQKHCGSFSFLFFCF